MAPKKKSRSLNGRPLHTNVPSAQKNYRSCKNQKKKLSDKLGPKWSKEEIKCFYEGYRKFGQDWEKVASSIYDRSIEMVEALYNTNKAYLSLPEGTASVVGLTALMTDYYHVMGGSDSERENYDASGFQKLPKTNQGKVKMSVSNEDHLTTHSVTASGGCLSSLRSLYYGDQPRVVGKRTPRFPISCSNTRDEWESRASESKSWQKSEVDVNSDEVEHVAALALTEASQRRGSPSTSVPCKIKENMKSSYEVSGGHKGRPYEEYGCDPNSLVDRECVKTVEAHHKTKKWYRKKKVIDVKNRRSHQNVEYLTENRLETSNMDDLCSLSVPEGNVGTEISNAEYELLSPLVEGKKSRKLLHEDENTALDALQTLVDLSLMMPYTAAESESSAQLVEETESFNLEDKSCIPQATLSARSRDKGKQTMVNAISGIGNTSYMQSKSGRGLSIDVVSKKKKRLEQPDTTWKRKRKLLIPDDTKVHVDVHLCENLKTEATSEHIEPIDNENQVTLPIKLGSRSRHKMELKKLLTPQKTKSCDDKLEKMPMKYSTSTQDRGFFLKDKLSNCMSSTLVRRWCVFEWFYSAIDYPWFARREFIEYLDHVGLENLPRLTRVEWGVVRSSLGKPRRFSERFLHVERMKLEHYRESVRQHYSELCAGIREGLPTDLARPLSVGQRVIALHPKTREVHDGSVLTVYNDKCRILFDDQMVGVKLVMDFDCMPSNPMYNLPEALKRQSCSINTLYLECKEPQANMHPNLSRKLEKASSQHTTHGLVPYTTFNLKQHNNFSGYSLPLWLKPQANTSALRSIPCSLNVSQESGCRVADIVNGSREKAQLMVLSSTKEGDDPLTMVWGALHSFDNQISSSGYQKLSIKSQDLMNDNLGHFNQFCSSEHLSASDSSIPSLRHPDQGYAGVPSDLITSCVAALFMIQACIECPYPPGDVAQILGSAVKSLHPRCSQNLHFYKEIETCIGRIKTQLLAIVPT
ncbi:protein ALWAYS EARLY 2-like isoform X2 [Momordica charantia]|uniref:Protein ALWAYS EARLY 2-like isoform X2 n=1 Tax=Momordica charantia TaxID=3673 RepID=A0A6J1D9A8_MOMCH|nr:protein ALWAYS EARLY 2-like isoform X2 [Momordica charantia]